MNEKDKYLSLYNGSLAQLYCSSDARGRVDGGYGRAFWGQGMVEYLEASQPGAVLDVGCGYGRFCDAVSRFVPQVYGVDIASVKTGNVIDNPKVTFIDAEAKEIPLPDRIVDWVTSFDCLEHCLEADIDLVLREFDRLARRGFILSISYDQDYIGDVPLHMTVRPETWWIEKLSAYGKVVKTGQVPLTGVPYLICKKQAAQHLDCRTGGTFSSNAKTSPEARTGRPPAETTPEALERIARLLQQCRIRCTGSIQDDPQASGNDDVLVATAERPGAGAQDDPSWNVSADVTTGPASDGSLRILYSCPDIPILSAGIRRLYRHVRCLVAHGYDAAVLHQQEGFKAPNQPDVPIRYLSRENLSPKDIVVIPEGHPQLMQQLSQSACRRFAIALNWDYIFKTLPDNLDWRHFGIERVLVVSPIVGQLVSWAMGLPVHILNSGINTQLYSFNPEIKRPRICYIKRKAACISEIRKMLRARNSDLIERLEWIAMEGLPERDYADLMQSSTLFLNLSPAEGWITSCLEAMGSGTFVAGYNSVGGKDLLIGNGNGQNAILAPNQDYMTLCLRIEPFLKDLLASNLQQWEHIRQNGLELAARMTMEAEENSIIAFWNNIVDVSRQHSPSPESVIRTEKNDFCSC